MIEVSLKLFGPLRDVAGTNEMNLSVPAPQTGAAAFEALAVQHPQLKKWERVIRLAVNLEYVSFDRRLNNGDEVCFITPISGG